MRIDSYINLEKMPSLSGLISAMGSFGIIDGHADYTVSDEDDVKKYVFANGEIELVSAFTEYSDGVIIRRDSFKNISDKQIKAVKISIDAFDVSGKELEGILSNTWYGWSTDIDDITTLTGVYGEKGAIAVKGHASKQMAVYGTDGKFIRLVTIGSDSERVATDAGVYIVKVGNAVAKVIVK